MKAYAVWVLSLLSIICCRHLNKEHTVNPLQAPISKISRISTNSFTKYIIREGAHECEQRRIKRVSGSSMNFIAKFDSSAIYPAIITDYNHSFDINKLWGFSEGWNNHDNSARIGWRWMNNQLQLFAYVYVHGKLLRDAVSYDPPFIKTVAIGAEVNCSIAISANSYIFSVDEVVVKTTRGVSSPKFSGYQQFPYFGGVLTAPHLITIYIK